MVHILVRLTVADLPRFLSEYASLTDVQYRAHGWRRSDVFQVVDDEHEVVLLLGWDDRASFENFLKDPTVWQKMTGTGEPKIAFLKAIGEFSR